MSKFVNNVRSRLQKQGITGFTKQEIEAVASEIGCTNLAEPTSQQILDGVEALKKVRGGAIEPTYEAEEILDVTSETEWAEEALDVPPIENEDGEAEEFIPRAPNTSSLVKTESAKLGLILSDEQVVAIADTIDADSDDLHELLRQVKSALINYANNISDGNDAAIQQTLAEVTDQIVYRSNVSAQKMADGFDGIAGALISSRENTKSQLQGILNRLNVPADSPS